MNDRDIILMGLPRSGTTLTCWLLNRVPDVVALAEPWLGLRFWLSRDPDRAAEHVGRFFERTRARIRTRRTAPSFHIRGEVPMNFAEEAPRGGRRRGRARFGSIRITKALSPDFRLVVKHPVLFAPLLERLVRHHLVFAIIRNPLAVLASWNSVPFPISKGRVPNAEWFDPSLRRALSRLSDRFDRQLYLLAWFFERYERVLPQAALLRYEDIVASGGRALATIVPEAMHLTIPLQDRNANPLYDPSMVRALGQKLLRTEGPYWRFYSREDVERVMEEISCASPS